MTIVEELRSDRESGARRLEAEYRAGLMTLARRFCADEGDAEELVNRTFAAVVEGIDDYLEQSAFFGWMCKILENIHAKDVRRKSNRTEVGDHARVEAAQDDEAGERIFREVDASLLRDAIAELPADMKEALLLRYFMDLPVGRIARILAIPEGTVKWRLHCARMVLSSKLGATRRPGARLVLLALLLAAGLAIGGGVVALVAGTGSNADTAEVEPCAYTAEFVPHAESAETAEAVNAAEGGLERARSALPTPAQPASNAAEGGLEPSTTETTTMKASPLLAATASLALAASPAAAAGEGEILDRASPAVSLSASALQSANVASAATGDELLVNGDFETGARAPWIGGSIGDSSSPYQPNLHTMFISGTYCGIIQRPADASLVYATQSQTFTNTSPCYAKLSWKCKRRTNNSNPVYYRVTVDGKVIWGEEKFTGSEIWYRKVDNVRLAAGEHTLAFQVRTDNNVDSTLFIDDVSLRNMGRTITELLLNGDFETGSKSPGWTGSGTIDNSSSAYAPNHTTTFIAGNYCSTIQMSRYLQQVFTNTAPYVATLSWRCKHRTNFFAENPMYYTVTIDGKTVWGEEKLTGSDVQNRSVEGIKLKKGAHTLVFQGRTDNGQDSSIFLDDVSLWVTGSLPGMLILVR